jgi:hypothetical protein
MVCKAPPAQTFACLCLTAVMFACACVCVCAVDEKDAKSQMVRLVPSGDVIDTKDTQKESVQMVLNSMLKRFLKAMSLIQFGREYYEPKSVKLKEHIVRPILLWPLPSFALRPDLRCCCRLAGCSAAAMVWNCTPALRWRWVALWR